MALNPSNAKGYFRPKHMDAKIFKNHLNNDNNNNENNNNNNNNDNDNSNNNSHMW